MIKIKTQSNTVSITDTAVQATPLVEEEVGHINVKVSKVKMRTRSELATDNIYVTAKNMITLNQIHKGVDDAAVQIYPEPTIVAVPTLSGTYTYTGQEQTVTISTYDPLHIAVSGTTAATNAGTYTVVFSLIDTDADVWEDGTTEDKTATWVIGRQSVEIPTVYTGYTQTFDGYTHSPYIYYNGSSWSYYSFVNQYGNIITVGGDISVTNAGEYEVTFDLVNTANYMWSDGTVEQKSDTWEIEKAILDVPVAPADASYDTYTHYAPSYSYSLVNTSGTTSATDVGTYTATYDIRYPNDLQWSDGTTEQKSITWQIVKGPANINISSTYAMKKYQLEEYMNYSRATGNITSVTSSNSSKVSVSNDSSNGRLILKSLAVGDVTITINIAGNDNAYAGSKTITVSNSAGLRLASKPSVLGQARTQAAGVSVGSYALFAGGGANTGTSKSSSISYNNVDAYNTSLIRSQPTALSGARYGLASAKVGNYGLFAGGGNSSAIVEAYNTSLSRSTPTGLNTDRSWLAGATVGSYALFAGGYVVGLSKIVDAYNTSLTHSIPTELSAARGHLAGATVGSYALFAGGQGDGGVVDAYNSSLTRSVATSLSTARRDLGGTTVGNYALFAGGSTSTSYSNPLKTVDAYNASLTRTSPTQLSSGRIEPIATTIGTNYAVFGSNNYYERTSVETYDTSLTKTILDISTNGEHPAVRSAAAAVGNYAVVAGGYGSVSSHIAQLLDNVLAYRYVA